jgi:hypothetical protein
MSGISRINFILKLIPSFLIVLMVPLFAYANEDEGGWSKACKPDIEKFCKDVKPGEGRILRCMKENHDNLSGECKQQMAEMKEKMHEKMTEAKEACKEDIEEFCKDVKPGGGRIMQCLKKHEEHISKKCQSAFEKHEEKQHMKMENMKEMDMKDMKGMPEHEK